MTDPALAARLLDVIERDILPLTRSGVAAGNKVFGAAILRRGDLTLVLAETNAETENPLWHGEIHALKRFHERADRPDPAECLFLSTHEPCTMCASALAWAGFREVVYFFTHQDSRDAFAIPHDLKILHELFGVDDWRRENAFYRARSWASLDDGTLRPRAAQVRATYDALSSTYQTAKGHKGIPLA